MAQNQMFKFHCSKLQCIAPPTLRNSMEYFSDHSGWCAMATELTVSVMLTHNQCHYEYAPQGYSITMVSSEHTQGFL